MAPTTRRWLPYDDAKAAVRAAGITTQVEYHQRYRTVPGLPSTPLYAYAGSWEGWATFLGVTARFLTLPEAVAAVARLGIRSQKEYVQRYREDAGLPSNPNVVYAATWPGWGAFLGTGQPRRRPRQTLEDVQSRARSLGLRTRRAYLRAAEHDPHLSTAPTQIHGWPGWEVFLGVERATTDALTYEQARAAVQSAGLSTFREYTARYREIPGLPSTPPVMYADEWISWPAFLAPKVSPHLSYEQAVRAARAAGFRTAREYQAGYRAVPGLPSMPAKAYRAQWPGWKAFLEART